MNYLKEIPDFNSIEEETKFWDEHDSANYIDWSKAKQITLSDLKSSI